MFNQKEYMKKYYMNNKEKLQKCTKQWHKDNPERTKKYMKQYRENNHEKLNEDKRQYRIDHWEHIKKYNNEYIKIYQKHRNQTDLKYNVNRRMGKAIWQSLHSNKNRNHWEILVGYTIDDLIRRLKKSLPKDYIWQDYMKGKLQIDHIIPKSVFNYTKPEHIDFKRCWALSNLRLLPARENNIKHNKLSKPFQPALQIC